MAQCTAHSKRTGNRCGAQAITGRAVCRWHGGTVKRGIAHHNYKHGRRSKYLPQRMLASFAAAYSDPDKLAMDAELAVLDARLDEVLSSIDSGASDRHWRAVQAAWEAVETARLAHDLTRLPVLMETVGALITQGSAAQEVWDDVRSLIRDRQRLVESERKRLIEAQHVVSVEHAMLLNHLLIDAVRRHVSDADILRAVADEWHRLAAGAGIRALGPAAPGGGGG